jgi:hypothetical protein
LVIGLQEIKLGETSTFTIPQYHIHHQSSVPHHPLPLRTDLQAIVVMILTTRPVILASIYSSRSHRLSDALMTKLFRQLLPPVLLLGDLISYHGMWGCEKTDHRGVTMTNSVDSQNLVLLNTGHPTRNSRRPIQMLHHSGTQTRLRGTAFITRL